MRKNNYLSELRKIQNMANSIRKINLNENVCFEDNETLYNDVEEYEGEEPEYDIELSDKDSEDKGMEELDANGSLDTIRELTLKGMTRLCKTPEDSEFQALLKIFQICNKGAEPKDDKKDI